jgi:hypothetical protein
MTAHFWLETILLLSGLIATLLVFKERLASQRGTGVRTIQLLVAVNILPLIGLLALEGKVTSESVGTLLGVVSGYTLAGILKPVPARPEPPLT